MTDLKRLLEQCESPIESKLAEALFCVFDQTDVRIIPQFWLRPFRYDFALLFRNGPGRAVYGKDPIFLVECDGKDFHGPAQLENDLAKDAAARANGSPCLRYRGAVIYRNPYAIAVELSLAVDHMRSWAVNGAA